MSHDAQKPMDRTTFGVTQTTSKPPDCRQLPRETGHHRVECMLRIPYAMYRVPSISDSLSKMIVPDEKVASQDLSLF
jgi:hypothetical protein